VPIALDILLPPEPVSGREARARIEPLAGSVGADVLDDVSLLVSELVTNSVRHARFQEGESIEVSLKVNDVLRVEVRDPGPGFDRRTFDDAGPLRSAGWGLLLVDRLTDRWGVDRTGGTKVWFEIGLGSGLPAIGDLTDDEKLKREGKLDQAGATVKKKTGDAVDSAKDKMNEALNR